MNTLQELQNKEKRLADRISRLKLSISALKENLTEQNLEAKAKELHSLEVQLELTEQAWKNTQDQLKEQEKLLSSKAYKDKLKQQENLHKQAVKQTRSIYEKLVEVQKEAKAVLNLTKDFDKLNKETLKETGNIQSFLNLDMRQPFSWLRKVYAETCRNLNTVEKYLKDKLEV